MLVRLGRDAGREGRLGVAAAALVFPLRARGFGFTDGRAARGGAAAANEGRDFAAICSTWM